jgi:hypothetical protein
MALRAALFDRSGKQLREMPDDSRVCDCCSTDTAVSPDGVIVAYRGRSADEVRDVFVSRYVAGRWGPPILVHNDGWRIEACPVNGPVKAGEKNETTSREIAQSAGRSSFNLVPLRPITRRARSTPLR